MLTSICVLFFLSSIRLHTRCALVTGVQTCALPVWTWAVYSNSRRTRCSGYDPHSSDLDPLPPRRAVQGLEDRRFLARRPQPSLSTLPHPPEAADRQTVV